MPYYLYFLSCWRTNSEPYSSAEMRKHRVLRKTRIRRADKSMISQGDIKQRKGPTLNVGPKFVDG